MKRTVSLVGSGLTIVALTVMYALAVQAQEASDRDEAPAAIEEARAAVEAARAEAAQAAEEAKRQAEAAVAQAEAAAQQAARRVEELTERAAAEAERAAEASAEIVLDADPFAGPVAVPMGGPDANPFGGGGDILVQAGPARVKLFAKGGTMERRAADPETMQKIELDRKLSAQIAGLAAKYKAVTDDEQRATLAKDLSARVADQFTVRQALREKELVDLEEQVERLRGLHDKRNEQKERIIEDRVQQLLREAEGLGWGDAGGEFGGGEGAFKFHMGELPVMEPLMEADVRKMKRIIGGAGAGWVGPKPPAGVAPAPVPVPALPK